MRPAKVKEMIALAKAVKVALTTNKCKNAKDSSESVSEDEKENFNFETLKIGEQRRTARTPRSNEAEVPEKCTEAEKELYRISN